MTGRAFDATVRITHAAFASIGTSLGPRLLEEAKRAAAESLAAAAADYAGDANDQFQKCLVAILCAHAAVEAHMNEVGDATDAEWWAKQQPKRLTVKWKALAERRAGRDLPDDDPTLVTVSRLNGERNQLAHYRGLKQADGSNVRAGPPVEDRGNISVIRAYYDAARAATAVADAESAFLAL